MADLALATADPFAVTDRLWAIVTAGTAARRGWSIRLPCRRPRAVAPLRAAVERVVDLIPRRRLLAVLARGDAHDADGFADVERVIQPAYRGSAAEAFLPLSMIARRDPSAIVVLLPGRGVGQDEEHFLATLEQGTRAVAARPDLPLALGLAPPCPRGPGWLEPGALVEGLESFGVRTVRRFVRRPSPADLATPQAGGALVNTGVVVGHAQALLALGRRRLPDVLETLEPLQTAPGEPEEHVLREAVYEGMPYADLSHALFVADEPFGVLVIPRARARLKPVASA